MPCAILHGLYAWILLYNLQYNSSGSTKMPLSLAVLSVLLCTAWGNLQKDLKGEWLWIKWVNNSGLLFEWASQITWILQSERGKRKVGQMWVRTWLHIAGFQEIWQPLEASRSCELFLGYRQQGSQFYGHMELSSANNWMNKEMYPPLELLERNTALPTPWF